MKPSELKPGDYFHRTDVPNLGIWRRLAPGDFVQEVARHGENPAVCVVAESNSQPVGAHSSWGDGGSSIELVPMPHTEQFPYVIGRAYRTRGAGATTYKGLKSTRDYPTHPHEFIGDGGRSTITNGGMWSPTLTPCEYDIMGEWREAGSEEAKAEPAPKAEEGVELIAGHTYRMRNGKAITLRPARPDLYGNEAYDGDQGPFLWAIEKSVSPFWYNPRNRGQAGVLRRDHGATIVEDITNQALQAPTKATSTQPKESTPVKRTLPTVTLDDIFHTLVKHNACWAEHGPLALSLRLQDLATRVGVKMTAPISLRTLNDAVMQGAIQSTDAGWIGSRMEDKIDPEGIHRKGTWGPALAKALDEWENPKPKIPTIGELKPGTRLRFSEYEYMVLDKSDSSRLTERMRLPENAPVVKLATGKTEHFASDFTNFTVLT